MLGVNENGRTPGREIAADTKNYRNTFRPDTTAQVADSQETAALLQAVMGKTGNIRLDCFSCRGSQKKTLSVDAGSGTYQCFRCGIKGNAYKGGNSQTAAVPFPEYLWGLAEPVTEHPYLATKGIHSYGLRSDRHGNLVVPLSIKDRITSLQFISGEGRKTLLSREKGGRKKGSSFRIGRGNGDTIYMVEGYATGASIYEATEGRVYMAVDAGNLKPAAENLRQQYPEHRFVFCADNDRHKPVEDRNYDIGCLKAREAAQAVGGTVCLPESTGYDFNDLHRSEGLEAVRLCLDTPAVPENKVAHQSPEPLPDELQPVVEFDFELMPDTLRPWAEDICERVQCPPDFVAVGIMAGLGSLIGRKIAIRPQARTDWTVVPNLWAMVVGRPGVLKSPALEAALAPLKQLAAKATERYQEAEADFRRQELAAKLKKENSEKRAKAALKKDPDTDLLSVLSVDEPDPPTLKRYLANDMTPASLGELLRQNPDGLLVFRDEIVSLLKSLDREGQEEGRGFYLTAWNGDSPYTFDRIGRGLNLHIPAVCLSVLGGTQPGRLAEYIRHAVKGGAADDGLIQRFGLLVWPDTKGSWKDVDRWPDTAAKNGAFKLFKQLDELNPLELGAEQDTDFNGDPDGPPFLRFTPGALEIFQELRLDLEKRLRGDDLHPALESHFAKYRKLIPSLALILHLADSGTGPVTERPVLQALAWGEYLESHARRAYGSISQPEITVAKAILQRIKKGDLPRSFSSRDVYRPGWAKLTDRHQVKEGLDLLEEYGWLVQQKIDTGGRPRTVYQAAEEVRQ